MTRRPEASPAVSSTSALDELLAAEQQIAARQAAVATECEALLEDARKDADAIADAAATALDAERVRWRAEAERACAAAASEVEADAAKTVERYRTLDGSALDALAEWVAAEVTGMPANGAPAR